MALWASNAFRKWSITADRIKMNIIHGGMHFTFIHGALLARYQIQSQFLHSKWRWFHCAFAIAYVIICCEYSIARAQEPLQIANQEFSATHQPIIKKFCGECHFGEAVKAGVNLELDSNVEAILRRQETWESVLRVLAEEEMPPEDSPQPSIDERAELRKWLDYVLHTLRCSARINPGAASLRRLNRTEYRNTIRDFTGVDYEPANQFPGDDVGYGFDNIGDVLSLPPILLEKYIAAAEQISAKAIVDTVSLNTDRVFQGGDLDACKGAYTGANVMTITENGTVSTVTPVLATGRYKITVSAMGHQAGDEPARMQIIVNGKSIDDFDVKSQYPDAEAKSIEVDLAVGDVSLGVAFINDFLDRNDTRATGNDRNLIVETIRVVGPIEIQPESLPEFHRRWIHARPDKETSQTALARKVIPQWLRLAFRRTPTDAETNRFVQLAESALADDSNLEKSMRLVLQAILMSPNFLYKVEQPLPSDGTERSLNDFELATSLSYFLWSTMPDEELLDLAAESRLRDPAVYREQVHRMLRDTKSVNLVENFAAQWLQLRQLDLANPNPEKFPLFDDSLRADMMRETKLFLNRVFRDNESILRLLDDKFSFLNERMADYYGVPGVEGKEFRRVNVSAQNRVGILTHASILTLSSYPARTSPVKRGKWIMENLLGQIPPPPDPAAMPLDEQHELVGTLRQRMEQHRRNPNCASCHERMDPLGFALENFDAIGRWRDEDEGMPIDASASFPDGTKFNGAGELQQMLAGSELQTFLRCFVEKLMTFALGRGLEYEDECVVDAVLQSAAKDDYKVQAIIVAIVESEPFRKRQSRGVQ